MRRAAVNRKFDPKVYLSFTVRSLKFDLLDSKDGNVVMVSLALRRGDLDYTYRTVRYMQYYRFDGAGFISYGTVSPTD